MTDRLTRTELSWLLMQEARHAAQKLRRGVGLPVGETEIRERPSEPPPPAEGATEESGGVETTLDNLDQAMSMLSSLYGQQTQPRGKRGRIDVAALVWEIAPEARVQIEMGKGLTVTGYESELRRMLHVLMSESADPGAERAAEVSVKREGEEVRIAVQLGPDRSSLDGTELRWLARMAARHGGRLSLESNDRILALPADDETNEIETLRKELAIAQAQGEAYARELARTRSAPSEPPPSRGFATTPTSENLACLVAAARGMTSSVRGILASIGRDMTPLRDQEGEAGEIAASVARHLTAASELIADLGKVASCPLAEVPAPGSVLEILREVVQHHTARAARHDVKIALDVPESGADEPIASQTVAALFHQLLGWAVAASPAGSTVKVSYAETDARMLVAVEDAGPVLPIRPAPGAAGLAAAIPGGAEAGTAGTRIDFDALPMTRPMHVALVAAQAIAGSLDLALHVETGMLSGGGAAGAMLAWIVGFAVLAVVDAVLGPGLAPPPGLGALLLRTFHGVGTLLAVGVALGGAVGAGAWLLARQGLAVRLVACWAGGVAVAHEVLERVLWRQADSAFDGRGAALLFVLFVALVGASPVVVHVLGALAAPRPRWRAAAVAAGVLGAGLNHAFFRDDYAEIHAVVGGCAGLLVGASLAPRIVDALVARPRPARAAAIAIAALAVAPLLLGVPNAVRKELFRSPGAAGAWALAMTRWEVEGLPPPAAPPRGARFFRAPTPEDAPIAPSAIALADVGPPVVVLITIDAFRADALADRSRDATWPTLARLRDESAWFTHARAPGSQTAVSLTAAFSGRTFSEMFWAKHGVGSTRFEYAAADPTPRLPALLADEDIASFKVVGTNFLANEFGTAAGFTEEDLASKGRRHAKAREIEGPLIEALRGLRREPKLLYAHFMEPHAPYDRGEVRDGSKKERYLSEIAALDGTLERLLAVLDGPRLRGRAWLIVSSDHGEAFGEHDTWEHTKTLYDEMIRVPLLVRGPGVVPRVIDEPVTLLDVGPTVLDVFRTPIPAAWAGQSLVPLLRGDDVDLERPILAEGRRRRAIVMPDGMKVIVDLRRKLVEAYDLAADPGELDDVWDDPPDAAVGARARLAAAALEAYYAAREARAPGYEPVYKP